MDGTWFGGELSGSCTWEWWNTSHEQLQLIEDVDLSKAEATFQTDKERIDRSVSNVIGFHELNLVVREVPLHGSQRRAKTKTYKEDRVF
jgi:hypothetical protein